MAFPIKEKDLLRIREFIRLHGLGLGIRILLIRPGEIDESDLSKLQRMGIISKRVADEFLDESYLLGRLVSRLGEKRVKSMSLLQIKRAVRKLAAELSDAERLAINAARIRAGQHLRAVFDDLSNRTTQEIATANAKLLRDQIIVRKEVARNIARAETTDQLHQRLLKLAEDAGRNWRRVAITEKQAALLEGAAVTIASDYPSEDPLVYKKTTSASCKQCRLHHGEPDQEPKRYRLSHVRANGSNVGRKASTWLIVLGPMHPHCQCPLLYGGTSYSWVWNANIGSFVPSKKQRAS